MILHYKLFKFLAICLLLGSNSNCTENPPERTIPESVSKSTDIIPHLQNLTRHFVRGLPSEAYTYNGNEHYALVDIHFGRLFLNMIKDKEDHSLYLLDIGSCLGEQARWVAQYLREHHNELPRNSIIHLFNITGEKEIEGVQEVENYSISGREIIIHNYLDFDIEHLDTELHRLYSPTGIPFGTEDGKMKLDGIMSQVTLMHLVTPLPVFINAANCLVP